MSNGSEKPVAVKSLGRHFKAYGPRKETPISVERRFHIAADRKPRITTRIEPVERRGGVDWEVIVEIDGMRAGGRATPPPMAGKKGQGRQAADR